MNLNQKILFGANLGLSLEWIHTFLQMGLFGGKVLIGEFNPLIWIVEIIALILLSGFNFYNAFLKEGIE